MNRGVKDVFFILAICVASLIIYKFVMIDGRPYYWGAIEDKLKKTWQESTLDDGYIMKANLSTIYTNCPDYSTR